MEQWLIVILATAGLLVRVGLMLYSAGGARAKMASSALIRQLVDLCVAVLALWAVGWAIWSYTGNPVIGLDVRRLIGWDAPEAPVAMESLLVVLLASGPVVLAISERSRLGAVVVSAVMMGALVVPVAAHWVWKGWLARMGMVDFGGAAVIHLAAGVMAAVGAWMVGPRQGKFNRDGSSNVILGHSVPMALAGVGLTVVSWPLYVLAVAALQGGASMVIPVNVLLAAAAGGTAASVYGQIRIGRIDPTAACVGVLGGLVSVTAVAPAIGTLGAVVLGAVAGLLLPPLAVRLETRHRLDDPGSIVAIHGIGGLLGVLAAGVMLADPSRGWLASLGVQALGAVAVIALAGGIGLIGFGILRAIGRLRVREADEYDGLDLAEHDVNAYPDFQQTMIKSYHLREA